MKIGSIHYRTVWHPADQPKGIRIIDQRKLPWQLELKDLFTVEDVALAIREMYVRGAGCIGATAAYGMWLAAATGHDLAQAASLLKSTRPTAVNLAWAVDRMLRADCTLAEANLIADEDAEMCRQIGLHGVALFQEIADRKKGRAVNVLTHCNAGWLAFVDHGSATSPIYWAHDLGLPVHVWVDETRPRNQGARLTAYELSAHGVPHTVIADNAGGHLMQRGEIDLVITGADRVTRCGDVANKIGTYLKALAARDNGVPFYVALPSSTFDWEIGDGLAGIPIEERSPSEIQFMDGPDAKGQLHEIRLIPEGSAAANPAFDVTPARLVTGLITERGICPAEEQAIAKIMQPQAC